MLTHPHPDHPVDIVYTWVDGTWPGHLDSMQTHAPAPIDLNPERYRDAFDCLKYAIRSLLIHLPWINNIHIVTARPQVPAWLNTDHSRIRIVHHDEIIPERYLPTFNSNTIESFVHKVPDLTDHFIYSCDDFLYAADMTLDDFWRDGRYTVFNTLVGENMKFRVHTKKNNIIGYGYFEHGPLFARRDFWAAMLEMLPEQQEATRNNRFRQDADLEVYKLYRRYMLSHQRALSRPIPIWKLKRIAEFHKIENDFTRTKRGLDRIRRRRPKFYTLNDDQKADPNPQVVALVRDFLSEMYPEKSEVEL